MSKVILFGTGRGADVAYRFLKRDSGHEVCGFTTDRRYFRDDKFHDLPVVPFEEVEERFSPAQYKMLVVLGYQGMNALRAEKYLAAKAKGYGFISYVNSAFYRAEDLNIGENCFILDNQSISLDVKIGNNVVMWSSNHIGDLSTIADHNWLASNVTVAAEVNVEPYCFLGIGATVGNKLTLGRRTFVGANVLVASDTADPQIEQLFRGRGAKHRNDDTTRYRSIASIPIRMRGVNPWGVLVATSDVAGRFQPVTAPSRSAIDHVEPLRVLATNLAAAIDRTHIVDRLERAP